MSDVQRAVDAALELTARFSTALDDGLLARIRLERKDSRRGAGSLRRGDVPDPTFEGVGSRAEKHLAAIHAHVRRLYESADLLVEIAACYEPPENACRPCWLYGFDAPVARRGSGEPYRKGLCRWHNTQQENGKIPSRAEVEAHHRKRSA